MLNGRANIAINLTKQRNALKNKNPASAAVRKIINKHRYKF